MPKGVYERTPEGRANLAAAKTGLMGEQCNNWRGDNVGLKAAHTRHRKVLPQVCAFADETCRGPLQASFRHDTPPEFVKQDPRGSYSTRSEDYRCLCVSHHTRYDQGGNKCPPK